MSENLNVPLIEDGGSNKGKKWVVAGLILLMFIFFGTMVYALVGIASNAEKMEKHEERITVLEQSGPQSLGRIKSLEKATEALKKTTLAFAGDVEQVQAEIRRLDGEIKKAVKGHEKRLHKAGGKSGGKNHGATGQSKPKLTEEEARALVANAVKGCADRGGELVSENGKVICVPKVTVQSVEVTPPKVVQEPVQIDSPKVAQLDTSKIGTPCPGGGRSGTYQIINGQVACLLDGVVRVTESYRPEPEVVYVPPRGVIREEIPRRQEEEFYYEEDRGSSVLPWVIGGGALLWALNRNTSRAPSAPVATLVGGGLVNPPLVGGGLVHPPLR